MAAMAKRAGPYYLASMPRSGPSPVKSIVSCLGRKDGSDLFYMLKILTIVDSLNETPDEKQGKLLMHTEYTLLTLLRDQPGIVHCHGFFKDDAYEESDYYGELGRTELTGRKVTRYCLVLDCLVPHDYSNRNDDLINLQHYVIKEKKLTEKEAMMIFLELVKIVHDLHKVNVVHRDLKLGNMVVNKSTMKVTITNFCLGKHLLNDDDLLKDQRGSPAYISPEVLSGQPYRGKPSDIWALGVVLYTMLYGQFPFYHQQPQELFRKIKSVEFVVPDDEQVSHQTRAVLMRLLHLEPSERLTASQLHTAVQDIVAEWHLSKIVNEDQIVPDIDNLQPKTVSHISASNNEATPNKQLSQIERFLLGSQNDEHIGSHHELSLVPSGEPPPSVAAIISRKRKLPAVRRLSEDARPLSSAELAIHRNLLQRGSALVSRLELPIVEGDNSHPSSDPFLACSLRHRRPIVQRTESVIHHGPNSEVSQTPASYHIPAVQLRPISYQSLSHGIVASPVYPPPAPDIGAVFSTAAQMLALGYRRSVSHSDAEQHTVLRPPPQAPMDRATPANRYQQGEHLVRHIQRVWNRSAHADDDIHGHSDSDHMS